ncbi:MAG: hypothetical protein P8Y67_02965 [Alphaproteobacteria bacterium]
MHTSCNDLTPSVEEWGEPSAHDVAAGTATFNDAQQYTDAGSTEHAGSDSVKAVTRRPSTRASLHAPAIAAEDGAQVETKSDTRASLKSLLDRSEKTRIQDIEANADASFTSLFAPVAKESAEGDMPVANLADMPANMSLASLAAANANQEASSASSTEGASTEASDSTGSTAENEEADDSSSAASASASSNKKSDGEECKLSFLERWIFFKK